MGAFVDLILAVLLLLFSTAISLLITVPLVGALVRFRANYTPKGLQLDQEGGVQPHVGPVVTSYWAMLVRVKNIEGWPGLYKGIMPTLISSVTLSIFAAFYLGASMSNHRGQYSVPDGTSFQMIVYTMVLALATIPLTVLLNRSITTPHKLPYFAPRYSLRILLTPLERRRPWVLYLAPGLFAARILHILWVVLVARGVRAILLPNFDRSGSPNPLENVSTVRLTLYLIFSCLSTLVLCPLEVIATRLSIQRNHSSEAGFSAVPQDEVAAQEEDVQYAGADEDVVGLRSEDDPYIGLMDCAKRIVDEEGWGVLYRAWWLTLAACALSALS